MLEQVRIKEEAFSARARASREVQQRESRPRRRTRMCPVKSGCERKSYSLCTCGMIIDTGQKRGKHRKLNEKLAPRIKVVLVSLTL